MRLLFQPMTRSCAEHIGSWKYNPPYDFYNMNGDKESIEELLNGEFVSVLDEAGRLVGFFCFGLSARVPGGYGAGIYDSEELIDIGLGMEPSLTGKGMGNKFVAEGLAFARKERMYQKFRLVVASFNHRAIQVYRRNGFQIKGTITSPVDGQDVGFLLMEKLPGDNHD